MQIQISTNQVQLLENFSVAVPTEIVLITQGGQVDREDTLTVQGRLIDIVDNPLEGQTIEIWLGGLFLTNVTTDATGQFNAVHPVPADATLGPVLLETRFTGTGTCHLKTVALGTFSRRYMSKLMSKHHWQWKR